MGIAEKYKIANDDTRFEWRFFTKYIPQKYREHHLMEGQFSQTFAHVQKTLNSIVLRGWCLSPSSGQIPMLSISCPVGESNKRFSIHSMRTKPGEVWLADLVSPKRHARSLLLQGKIVIHRALWSFKYR
jgi:hypothetical protein